MRLRLRLHALTSDSSQRYLSGVITLVRIARVLVLLLLAWVAVSLVVGLAVAGTGAIEKVVLLALFAGCIYLAAQVSTFAARKRASNVTNAGRYLVASAHVAVRRSSHADEGAVASVGPVVLAA